MYEVNSKSLLKSKQWVVMLWTSLIYVIRVDGIHQTTKNWIWECIALCFLMIRSDLIHPFLTTTYPSEHSIAYFRGFIRELTVNQFISIIKRVDCMWSAMFQSSLSCVLPSKKIGVYNAKIDISGMKTEVKLESGPVHVETDIYENCCVTSIIWKYCSLL